MDLIQNSIPDFSLVSSNVLMFIAMQCLFFYFVGATLYDYQINKKVTSLKDFQFIKDLTPTEEENKKLKEEEEILNLKNRTFLWDKTKYFMLICLVIFIAGFLYSRRLNKWERVHWIMLMMQLGAFSTELVIYYFIIEPYEFYGTVKLMDDILSEF